MYCNSILLRKSISKHENRPVVVNHFWFLRPFNVKPAHPRPNYVSTSNVVYFIAHRSPMTNDNVTRRLTNYTHCSFKNAV